jgi:hypothetical protein
MKKNLKEIISAVLSVTMIVCICTASASTAKEKNLKVKPLILSGIAREKSDTNLPLETDKGPYSQNKSTVLNSKSKNILKAFNVNYNDIKSVEVIQNNELNKTEYRAKIGNASVDFDTDGNIVQFTNYKDISTVNTDNERKGGEPLPQEKYKLNSANDLRSIIDNIATANDLQGYKLVTCNNDLEGTWLLSWNKDLGNGITNPCDVAVATIDAKDGSVMVFDRSSITPNTTTPTVTKSEAIKLAQPVISKLGTTEKISAKLTVTRPNFYWEDGGPYKQADVARLAWEVTVGRNTAVIMVDAKTGEILGGDQSKGF